jgi:hypothetical protein
MNRILGKAPRTKGANAQGKSKALHSKSFSRPPGAFGASLAGFNPS